MNLQMEMITAMLSTVLLPICICFLLPVLIVWLSMRKQSNETNRRTEIMLAAIEKNADVDVSKLFAEDKKTDKKTFKEKLLSKLQTGCILSFIGLGLVIFLIIWRHFGGGQSKDFFLYGGGGAICIGIGIAYLISYFVGKKMLAKEMEAEQKELQNTAPEA